MYLGEKKPDVTQKASSPVKGQLASLDVMDDVFGTRVSSQNIKTRP
jgi:hypothetical protein